HRRRSGEGGPIRFCPRELHLSVISVREDPMEFDTLIRGGRAVFPGVGVRPADVAVAGGRIAAVLEPGSNAHAARVIEASGRFVTPGVVETHTHFGIGNGYEDLTTET